jgi:hypothetical protein
MIIAEHLSPTMKNVKSQLFNNMLTKAIADKRETALIEERGILRTTSVDTTATTESFAAQLETSTTNLVTKAGLSRGKAKDQVVTMQLEAIDNLPEDEALIQLAKLEQVRIEGGPNNTLGNLYAEEFKAARERIAKDTDALEARTLKESGKEANLAYQNYAGERGMQNQAVMNAPALAQADYADISQLANVGKTAEDYQKTALQADIDRFNFEQNKPYQKLSSYLGAAYGAPMGQVSKTTQSGGGKIVCTAMNKEYGFGSFRQTIWLAQSKDLDPAYEKGYHTLFLPLVNYAYKAGEKNALQRILRGVLEHIARHRTADIWKQKRGKKRDTYGMIYRAIIEPICYVVGKV